MDKSRSVLELYTVFWAGNNGIRFLGLCKQKLIQESFEAP